MDGPRPSSRTAPSTWYADVATPQPKPFGNDPGEAACGDREGLVADGAGEVEHAASTGVTPATMPADRRRVRRETILATVRASCGAGVTQSTRKITD
jgi:hypothetical protein